MQNVIILAKNGDVIKLAFDYEASAEDTMIVIPEGKDITLDLNGHTLSRELLGKEENINGHAIYVPKGATLHPVSSAEEKGVITKGFANDGGGHAEEWAELKAWVIRHNPEWAGMDPSEFGDGPVTRWLYLNIPEYDGYSYKDDGPMTYYVKGQDKPTMNHEEMMALLIGKYGE